MACNDCIPQVNVTYTNPYQNTQQTNCSGTSTCSSNASDITYNGANLTCTGINTNDKLDAALQKIDEKVCSVLGDYSTYNTNCIENITTEKEFVEAISLAYCTLQTDYDTFIGTTYVADKTTLTTLINTNNVPNITSACTTIFNPTSTDTVKQVLQKISASLCAVYSTALDLSGVTWDNCYTISSTPNTVAEGFQVVLDQICTLNSASSGVLPTFDNTSTCLTGGTSTDSLVTTIGLIKTQLCSLPTFAVDTLAWSCVTEPATKDLQNSFQAVLSAIDDLSAKIPVFSSDFTTSANGCSGTNVSLGTSVTDKKVASTSSDSNPGTLEDKLYAGDNVTLDYATTPGKVIIAATGGSASDGKVKINSGDTAGYLADKLEGDNGTINATVGPDTDTGKVQISINYDAKSLLTDLLNELNSLPDSDALSQLFCALVSRCPESCGTVSNVSVNYYGSTSTTTTTQG